MHFEPPTAAAEEMYTEPKFPAWLADTSLTGFYGFPAVELEGGRRVLKACAQPEAMPVWDRMALRLVTVAC